MSMSKRWITLEIEQTALERAITLAGSISNLARRINVTRQAIHQWEKVPANRVLEVERAVDGAVTREELRPDLYPDD
jgi:DNA-binding transcriptional regulator YdaS (Cro superfamily)|tara:strand:- start:1301 stop:1531 length:231 start_codon:yes stop_codon:yes gene_type:complete